MGFTFPKGYLTPKGVCWQSTRARKVTTHALDVGPSMGLMFSGSKENGPSHASTQYCPAVWMCAGQLLMPMVTINMMISAAVIVTVSHGSRR